MQQDQTASPMAVRDRAKRYRPSGSRTPSPLDRANFSEYISATREVLRQTYQAAGATHPEKRLEGNAPFELWPAAGAATGNHKPYRRGVLLIHGLTDSPYFMRPLGALFAQQGFRVQAILLPGHGTQPGDLLDSRWQEWARAVEAGVAQLGREVDEIHLAGYSAGAALAVRLGLLDERVRGLYLFSPAFRVSPWAALANLHKCYSWLWPRAKWMDVRADTDLYKYESFPENAAYQMRALIRDLDARLRDRAVNVPVFAAASAEDATVGSAAAVRFVAAVRHQHSKLVYYTPTPGHCPPGIAPERIELMNSIVPTQHILGFSHLSILLPPEDPHYGRAGDYSNCLHYYQEDQERYARCCRGGETLLQGEVTAANLRAGLMRRLTYNPHFTALASSLRDFILELP